MKIAQRLHFLLVYKFWLCEHLTTGFGSSVKNLNSVKHTMNMNSSAIESAVDFLQLTIQLKSTLRTGWVLRGVPRAESVADHSWHVALLSLFLLVSDSSSPLDVVKCTQVKFNSYCLQIVPHLK